MNKYLFLAALLILIITGWVAIPSWLKNAPGKHTVIPRHLGIIMDGNRRWAKRKGFLPWIGHQQGVVPAKTALRFCLDQKISYVTLYAFSLENYNRPEAEKRYLFDVLAQELAGTELNNLYNEGIRVRFVGNRTLFPEKLRTIIDEIEEKTKNNTRLFLDLLFCYGGQQEIVHAAQQLMIKAKAGELDPATLTMKSFEQELWTGEIPAPDLIIRTGGAHRLSNFLTYQSAYSELYFIDCFWPDIEEQHLHDALTYYEECKRNFGK